MNTMTKGAEKLDYFEFKRCIVEQLVNSKKKNEKATTNNPNKPEHYGANEEDNKNAFKELNSVVDNKFEVVPAKSSNPPHILMPTNNKQCIWCHLCKMINNAVQQKCGTCCTECELGFHVECFAAFHFCDELKECKPALHKVVVESK